MKPDKRLRVALLAAFAALALAAVPAAAAPSVKKSIWGPTRVDGVSQFPIYDELGVGIYQMSLGWNMVAPERPENPRDPADPAYKWSEDVDFAIQEAKRYGMKVSLMVTYAPPWANGGRRRQWAPEDPSDYADFVAAAARRYPDIHHWMIWGEPSRQSQFLPLAVDQKRTKRLTAAQRKGPRRYARILDAAYGALKAASRSNLVIGGNTFTTGDLSPYKWLKAMRLPNGKPPRLDLYGHNPFTARKPNLSKPPLGSGFADFSDLDTLAKWIDRAYRSRHKRPKIFISEFFWPTDHANHEFNFYVTRKTQAEWLRAALKITRRTKRIYTLGWFSLYDDPPRADGDEVNRGLIDVKERRKPAFDVFKDG
jgi:hypothetical protein